LYVCDGVAVQTRARGRKVGGGGISDDHVRKAPPGQDHLRVGERRLFQRVGVGRLPP